MIEILSMRVRNISAQPMETEAGTYDSSVRIEHNSTPVSYSFLIFVLLYSFLSTMSNTHD